MLSELVHPQSTSKSTSKVSQYVVSALHWDGHICWHLHGLLVHSD